MFEKRFRTEDIRQNVQEKGAGKQCAKIGEGTEHSSVQQ